MARSKKAPSAADGKRFGTTTILPEKSMLDIQGVLTKYGVADIQWTTAPGRYSLRFVLSGRRYLFAVQRIERDPQETKRLMRVLWHYLDSMFAMMDGSLFSPENVLLAFLEVAPEVNFGDALRDDESVAAIRNALVGCQLALGPRPFSD